LNKVKVMQTVCHVKEIRLRYLAGSDPVHNSLFETSDGRQHHLVVGGLGIRGHGER
jgi:hypothetical protein